MEPQEDKNDLDAFIDFIKLSNLDRATNREYLYQMLLAPNLKPPTPFKSIEEQEKEGRLQAAHLADLAEIDIQGSMNLFLDKAEDKDKVLQIFLKMFSTFASLKNLGKAYPITNEDLEVLEEIAKKELVNKNIEEAEAMYRLIIQLDPTFSGAWVGYALCEQELGNLDVAEAIYELALSLMPQDYFILLFAADFYVIINQKEKAKTILENAKTELIESNSQDSYSYKEIEHSLESL